MKAFLTVFGSTFLASILYANFFLYDFKSDASSPKRTHTKINLNKEKALLSSAELEKLFDCLSPSSGDYADSIRFNISEFFDTQKPATNTHKFDLILSPSKKHIPQCLSGSKRSFLVLAIVLVEPDSFDTRNIIRKTWGNRNLTNAADLLVIFVVGLARSEQVNNRIREEFNQHGDLIQENYLDSPFNLTVKVLGALKWIRDYCSRVRYVLRINEHMQVNVFSLIKYLKSLHITQLVFKNGTNSTLLVRKLESHYSNSVWGSLFTHSRPIRDIKNKWHIPRDEYDSDTFLPYMEGSAVLWSGDLAKSIYNLSTFVHWPRFSTALEVYKFDNYSKKTFFHRFLIFKKDVYIGMLCLHLSASLFPILERFVYAKKLREMAGLMFDDSYTTINLNSTAIKINTETRKQLGEIFFAFAHHQHEHFLAWHAFSTFRINRTQS
jgi:hypothetical protein